MITLVKNASLIARSVVLCPMKLNRTLLLYPLTTVLSVKTLRNISMMVFAWILALMVTCLRHSFKEFLMMD